MEPDLQSRTRESVILLQLDDGKTRLAWRLTVRGGADRRRRDVPAEAAAGGIRQPERRGEPRERHEAVTHGHLARRVYARAAAPPRPGHRGRCCLLLQLVAVSSACRPWALPRGVTL